MLVPPILHHILQICHVKEPCNQHLGALPPLHEGLLQLSAGALVVLPPAVAPLVVPRVVSARLAPAAVQTSGRGFQFLEGEQVRALQEVLWDFLPAESTALAVPGGAFHAQKTEDMAAGETDRVDAALQADGALRRYSGGGGGTARIVFCIFFKLGGSWGVLRQVHFSTPGHAAERNGTVMVNPVGSLFLSALK